MALSRLRESARRIIGTKETLRALSGGLVSVVFVAHDADEAVIRPVIELARQGEVELVYADSMRDLGRACGIEVGAASAAIPCEGI